MKFKTDARKWWKKWSTWLAGLAAAMVAAATGIVPVLAALPPELALAVAFVAVVAVPLATSISQWPEE